MSDRFYLEGVLYYQEFRKCGKSSCTVCRGGDGHGPYWYSRNLDTGERSYIGKELPEDVVLACSFLRRSSVLLGLVSLEAQLMARLNAVRKLQRREALSDGERGYLVDCGLAEALVKKPGNFSTQVDLSSVLRGMGYETLDGI